MALITNQNATGEKEALLITDHCQVSSLNGGLYFGKTGIKEQQFDLTSIGSSWLPKASSLSWYGTAMSSDGKIQLGIVDGGVLQGSSDYGMTWATIRAGSMNWRGCAMSVDGKIQVALDNGGYVYGSSNYGSTWAVIQNVARAWRSVAMSSDGRIIAAVIYNGAISVSINFGLTWNSYGTTAYWQSICMSSDGKIMTAVASTDAGVASILATSNDFGATWTTNASIGSKIYLASAMSQDGKIQIVTVKTDAIWLSTDYGATWSSKYSAAVSWRGLAMSANGAIWLAGDSGGVVYVTTNYGASFSTVTVGGSWPNIPCAASMSSDGKVMSLVSNGNNIYECYATSVCNGSLKNNTSAWNAGHLVIGAYHFWVDASGRLRIKSSAPTSDTDGTIVGTQS